MADKSSRESIGRALSGGDSKKSQGDIISGRNNPKSEKSTVTTNPGQNLGGVVITDRPTGNSVKTTIDPTGKIIDQKVRTSGGRNFDNKENAQNIINQVNKNSIGIPQAMSQAAQDRGKTLATQNVLKEYESRASEKSYALSNNINNTNLQNNSTPQQYYNMVTRFEEPTGLFESISYKASRQAQQLQTNTIRGEGNKVINEAARFGLIFGGTISSYATGLSNFVRPSRLKNLFSVKSATSIYSNLKDAPSNFGSTLATDPTKALAQSSAFIATSFGPANIGKGLTAAEKATGLPKYSTVFRGEVIAENLPNSLVKAESITTRRGLLSDSRFYSVSASQAQSGETLLSGTNRFIGGAFTSTREMTLDLLRGRSVFGKPIQTGNIFQGVSKDLVGLDKGFIFRGSSKSYGKVPSQSVFYGVGIQTEKGIASAIKNVQVVNGRLSKSDVSFAQGFIKKNANDFVDDLSPGSGLSQIGKGSKLSSINKNSLDLQKGTIEKSIESSVQKSRTNFDKGNKALGGIPSISASLPSVSEFYGKGLYERTDFTTFTGNVIKQDTQSQMQFNMAMNNPRSNPNGLMPSPISILPYSPKDKLFGNVGIKSDQDAKISAIPGYKQRGSLGTSSKVGINVIQSPKTTPIPKISYKMAQVNKLVPTTNIFGKYSYSPKLLFNSDLDKPVLSGDYQLINPVRYNKNTSFNIAPSFTASILDLSISNPIKVSKTFGVSPFQVRGLLKGKKRKGKYFVLTDL